MKRKSIQKAVTISPEAEGVALVLSVLQQMYITERQRAIKAVVAFFAERKK